MFRHYHHFPKAATSKTYYANEVAKMYDFPAGDGAGQTIALIELGGGYTDSDLQAYAQALNLPAPNIMSVSVDGATNNPADKDASGEVLLDIEVVMAVSPKAAVRVYFGQNSDQGFVNAILAAVNDGVDIISISWGASEDDYTLDSIKKYEQAFALAQQKNITVLVASGDSGADDDPNIRRPRVDYPASSDKVIACGGTQLYANGLEVVWNNLRSGDGASGGGVSKFIHTPSWQQGRHPAHKARCLPDAVGNASPLTGYKTYMYGQWVTIGGTSAVAPLYAGYFAIVNQLLGKNVGFVNDKLYTVPEMDYYDVVIGNNGFWVARHGYDIVSGLGRIDGSKLLASLRGMS